MKFLMYCFFMTLIALSCHATFADSIAGKRPNIVFFFTDDQGYGDVSAHGNPILKTPNLDRLRGEGVRFTDFHVSPTCAPTRSALFTGRHEFKNGITHTILEREGTGQTSRSKPSTFDAAGGWKPILRNDRTHQRRRIKCNA